MFRFAMRKGSNGPARESSNIPNIQSLRAFSAINVSIFHSVGTAHIYGYEPTILSFLEGWGANGVDIFFVISGFVLVYSQSIKKDTVLSFILQRLVRVVPLYWIVTLFTIALILAFPALSRGIELTPGWVVASLFFASQALLGKNPVVYVGWTLEWEMLFYIVFGFSLLFRSWTLTICTLFGALLLFSSLTGDMIVLEFLLGSSIACLYRALAIGERSGLLILSAGFLALLLSLSPALKALDVDRLYLWGIPAFFIVLGAVFARQFRNGGLGYLGDASYSIYLAQMLAIPAYYKLASRLMPGLDADLVALIGVASSVAGGCLLHRFLERPLTARLRAALKAAPSRPRMASSGPE